MGSETYAATTENGGKTWNYLNLEMPKISFYSHSIEKIFVNSNVCYILGDDMIYKSTDLFKSWETVHVPIEIKNACFIGSEVGYISDNFSIYKTNNGGETWKKLPGTDVLIGFPHFFDEFNGFDIRYRYNSDEYPWFGSPASSSIIYYTSDGGKTWHSKEFPVVISGYRSFPTNKIGYYLNGENIYVLELK
jgi:photosystem II stability/assembly factor-like uncharacterized protein